jgi:hypothetical protein
MIKILRIILALFLLILPATAAMALHDYFLDPYPGETISALSSAEARSLLKQAGFPELADSWIVDGYQGWYKKRQCLIQQELAAYSTPKETSPGIFRSNVVVLTSNKLIIKQPDCAQKLPAPQRDDIIAAAFGDHDHPGDKPPIEVSDLFWIGKKTTDAQLNLARSAVLMFQQCFKSPGNCPLVLKYYDVDEWLHKHVSLIRLNNIHSVGWIIDMSGIDNNLNIVFNAGEKKSLLMQMQNTNGPIHEIDLHLLLSRSHGP